MRSPSSESVRTSGSHTGGAPSKFAVWLYRLLLTSSTLGIVVPLATVVLKPAAHGFKGYHELVAEGGLLARLVERFPVLDLPKTAPWLDRLSWHRSIGIDRLHYYAHYAAFNVLALVVLLLARRHVMQLLERGAAWVARDDHRRERRIFFVAVVTVVLSFQLKAHLGFFYPGIAGWTYENRGSHLRHKQPRDHGRGKSFSIEEAPWLQGAVQDWNARWLGAERGWIEGPAFMLHYHGGQVLPASYELTGLVFPAYVFGSLHRVVRRRGSFVSIVRATLERRTAGKRFLLPTEISYFNHTPHEPVDYRSYPPASQLEAISLWTITVRLDGHGGAHVVRGMRHALVKVKT